MTWDTIDGSVSQYVPFDGATETFFYFTITNNEAYSIQGTLGAHGYYTYRPLVQTAAGAAVSNPITLPAGGSWNGRFRVMPDSDAGTEGTSPMGATFIPSDQYNGDPAPNFSEPNIEFRRFAWRGPFDAHNWSVGTAIAKLV